MARDDAACAMDRFRPKAMHATNQPSCGALSRRCTCLSGAKLAAVRVGPKVGCFGGEMPVAFDEMTGAGRGRSAQPYEQLDAWLKHLPPDMLEHRRREAELLFRRIGITFAVYGDADATERLIPFDVLPRIMRRDGMATLQARPRAAHQGHQRLHQGHVYGHARDPARRDRARRPGVPEPGVPAGDERPERCRTTSTSISPASTSCASTPTPSTCSRTTRARPPASPTCWRTARS